MLNFARCEGIGVSFCSLCAVRFWPVLVCYTLAGVGVSVSSLRAVIFCWPWNIACDVSKPDFPYSKKDGRFGVLGKWYCHCHFERGGITVADINTQLLAAVGAFLGQWLLKTN